MPRCFADVTCDTYDAGRVARWTAVCREVWSAMIAATVAATPTEGPRCPCFAPRASRRSCCSSPPSPGSCRQLAARRRRSTSFMHAYVGIPGVFELSRRPLDRRRAPRDLLLRRRRRAAVRAHQRRAELRPQGAAARDRRGRRRARADRASTSPSPAAPTPRRGGRSRPPPTSPSRSACSPSSARGCPPALRVFLLALAILDDIVGIVFIAVLFADRRQLRHARRSRCVAVVAFGDPQPACSTRRARVPIAIAARDPRDPDLGARLRVGRPRHDRRRAARSRDGAAARRCACGTRSSRGSTAIVLPLFAFSAALVADPAGVAARALAGVLGHPRRAAGRQDRRHLGVRLARRCASATGGGAPHAARSATCSPPAPSAASASRCRCCCPSSRSPTQPAIRDQAILGVLAGSVISLDRSPAILVSWRARAPSRQARRADRGGAVTTTA